MAAIAGTGERIVRCRKKKQDKSRCEGRIIIKIGNKNNGNGDGFSVVKEMRCPICRTPVLYQTNGQGRIKFLSR